MLLYIIFAFCIKEISFKLSLTFRKSVITSCDSTVTLNTIDLKKAKFAFISFSTLNPEELGNSARPSSRYNPTLFKPKIFFNPAKKKSYKFA